MPFLWGSPVENFIVTFKSFANYNWGGDIFYLGSYIKATSLLGTTFLYGFSFQRQF